MSDISVGATARRPATCEDCGLNYPVGKASVPITAFPYTCDDCGGYVDLVTDPRSTP